MCYSFGCCEVGVIFRLLIVLNQEVWVQKINPTTVVPKAECKIILDSCPCFSKVIPLCSIPAVVRTGTPGFLFRQKWDGRMFLAAIVSYRSTKAFSSSLTATCWCQSESPNGFLSRETRWLSFTVEHCRHPAL